MECLFCKIISNEIPSYTYYEDNLVKAFLDINPDSPGHTLIIPKKHYLDINDIDIEVLNHINIVIKELSLMLQKKLNMDGLTIVQNNGSAQMIKHYHVHLIPKYKEKKEILIEEIYNNLTN